LPQEFKMIARVNRPRAAARAAYDQMSKFYDWMAGSSEWPCAAEGLRLLDAQSGERVMEAGCGTGRAFATLSQAGAQAVGVDLSSGMLRQASSRFDQVNSPRLVQADALMLPFLAAAFDALFAAFTLELFDTPDIPLVVAEWKRVLRPGGRLVVVALMRKPGPAVRLYEAAHAWMPRWVDCRPIYPAQMLDQVGLRIVSRKELGMWGLPVEIVLVVKPDNQPTSNTDSVAI
jgi:ubiquinone/menaquinone biosynthesis C-methylase UbiE